MNVVGEPDVHRRPGFVSTLKLLGGTGDRLAGDCAEPAVEEREYDVGLVDEVFVDDALGTAAGEP